MRVDMRGFEIVIYDNQAMVQKQAQVGTLERMKREREEITQQSDIDRKTNSEELQKLIEEIMNKFDMLSKYLKIDIDTELEIPVAKIIERDTNRVIRQSSEHRSKHLRKR